MRKYKILFNFPSKGRFDKFKLCLKNLLDTIDDYNNCYFLFKFNIYDEYLNDYIHTANEFSLPNAYYINYDVSKVDAINKCIEKICYNWDIIITWSDDMVAKYKGFDNFIRSVFYKNFKDLDGCPGFWDGYRNDDLITLPVLGRKFYERFGYIYHNSYKSLYCDNEMTDIAKIFNAFVFIKNPQIISHEHPNNNKSVKYDKGYSKSESHYYEDYENYKKRLSFMFDL